MSVTPDPFWLEGGEVGVLMIHGFTGSPAELRPVANELHAQGWTVYAPLLPGHGTTPAEMNLTRFLDWQQAVDQALTQLQEKCTTVFAAGLSMGGLLVLDLAARNGEALAGVLAYAPALIPLDRMTFLVPVAKHFIKTLPKGPDDFVDKRALEQLWDYKVNPIPATDELLQLMAHVRRSLSQITTPLLVMHSYGDRIVDYRSSQIVYDHAASTEKDLVFLEGCGHVLTLDAQWREVAQRSTEFIRGVSVEGHGVGRN